MRFFIFVLFTSVVCIGSAAANTTQLDRSFVNCSQLTKSYKEKVLILHAASWPESLSHMVSIKNQTAYQMQQSSQSLDKEIRDFALIYKASVALAKLRCPNSNNLIARSMQKKFILAHQLKAGFDSLSPLLKNQEQSVKQKSKLTRSVERYMNLKNSIIQSRD